MTTDEKGTATVVLREGVHYIITADKAYDWERNAVTIVPTTKNTQYIFKSKDFGVRCTVHNLKTQQDAQQALARLVVKTVPAATVKPFKYVQGPLPQNDGRWLFQFWQGGLDPHGVTITTTIPEGDRTRIVKKDTKEVDFNY